jgi:hypothetical protein
LTPEAWVNYIPIKIDESKPPSDDALTSFYNKQNEKSENIDNDEEGHAENDYKPLPNGDHV